MLDTQVSWEKPSQINHVKGFNINRSNKAKQMILCSKDLPGLFNSTFINR